VRIVLACPNCNARVFSPLGKFLAVTPRTCEECGAKVSLHWSSVAPAAIVVGAFGSVWQSQFSFQSCLVFAGVVAACSAVHLFWVPLVASAPNNSLKRTDQSLRD
jgi:uncharacterized protein (DUF983 family)